MSEQLSSPSSPTKEQVHALKESLVDLGVAWAKYGLAVGRTALQTSAKSLETTATLLDNLYQSLGTDDEKSSATPDADSKPESDNQQAA
jgi:hypothetical protein